MEQIKELKGIYLRGYMPVDNEDDEYFWLFLDRGDVVCFEQQGADEYRDAYWEFNPNPKQCDIPERDSKYKAIGEYIISAEETGSEYEYNITIKTNTKVIKLTTDGSNDYYPVSIWDVI